MTKIAFVYPWKGGRSGPGIEWYNYPSLLAQEYWYHVLCLGKARPRQGYNHKTESPNGFLLHYIRRGEFWYRLQGQGFRASAQSVCLVDLSKPAEYGNDRRPMVDVWWICFNGRDMPHMFTELRADRDPVFPHLDVPSVERLFNQLYDLIHRQPPGYEPKSAGVLLTLIGELFTSRAKTGDFVNLLGRNVVLSEPVRRGIDYMTRFYHAPMPLKRICVAVNQSMYHFARVFHREVGMPPIQYLNRYRIEQAKRLLTTSNEPIAQVRLKVGIPHPVHFSQTFRKLTGMSAMEYKRRNRQRTRPKRRAPHYGQ